MMPLIATLQRFEEEVRQAADAISGHHGEARSQRSAWDDAEEVAEARRAERRRGAHLAPEEREQ